MTGTTETAATTADATEGKAFGSRYLGCDDGKFTFVRNDERQLSGGRNRTWLGTWTDALSGVTQPALLKCYVGKQAGQRRQAESEALSRVNERGVGPAIFTGATTGEPFFPNPPNDFANDALTLIIEDVGMGLDLVLRDLTRTGEARIPRYDGAGGVLAITHETWERFVQKALFDLAWQLDALLNRQPQIFHGDIKLQNICVAAWGPDPADVRATLIDFETADRSRLASGARDVTEAYQRQIKGYKLSKASYDLGCFALVAYQLDTREPLQLNTPTIDRDSFASLPTAPCFCYCEPKDPGNSPEDPGVSKGHPEELAHMRDELASQLGLAKVTSTMDHLAFPLLIPHTISTNACTLIGNRTWADAKDCLTLATRHRQTAPDGDDQAPHVTSILIDSCEALQADAKAIHSFTASVQPILDARAEHLELHELENRERTSYEALEQLMSTGSSTTGQLILITAKSDIASMWLSTYADSVALVKQTTNEAQRRNAMDPAHQAGTGNIVQYCTPQEAVLSLALLLGPFAEAQRNHSPERIQTALSEQRKSLSEDIAWTGIRTTIITRREQELARQRMHDLIKERFQDTPSAADAHASIEQVIAKQAEQAKEGFDRYTTQRNTLDNLREQARGNATELIEMHLRVALSADPQNEQERKRELELAADIEDDSRCRELGIETDACERYGEHLMEQRCWDEAAHWLTRARDAYVELRSRDHKAFDRRIAQVTYSLLDLAVSRTDCDPAPELATKFGALTQRVSRLAPEQQGEHWTGRGIAKRFDQSFLAASIQACWGRYELRTDELGNLRGLKRIDRALDLFTYSLTNEEETAMTHQRRGELLFQRLEGIYLIIDRIVHDPTMQLDQVVKTGETFMRFKQFIRLVEALGAEGDWTNAAMRLDFRCSDYLASMDDLNGSHARRAASIAKFITRACDFINERVAYACDYDDAEDAIAELNDRIQEISEALRPLDCDDAQQAKSELMAAIQDGLDKLATYRDERR